MKLIGSHDVLSEDDLTVVATDLLARIQPGSWVELVGDLGAGKTTFVRKFLGQLGYADPVVSPTYPLLVDYEIGERNIIHIDGFRLDGKSPDPWDWKEWGASIVFVEWFEKTKLPKSRITFRLEIQVETSKRIIRLFSV